MKFYRFYTVKSLLQYHFKNTKYENYVFALVSIIDIKKVEL